jgi:diguanylate cyclase (GGDEF)-like protein/PAS domain S-box-containing protein
VESHFRAIVEAQLEMVSVAHLDGTLAYVNPAYAAHFGKTPAELAGVSLYQYVDAHDQDAVRQLVARLAESGDAATTENRMRDAAGTERWVTWTNRVQMGCNGPPMLHSVGRDVTERKAAEAALRASQAFLTRSGRVAGVGGWEVDLASGRVTWSEETKRIHEVAMDFEPELDKAILFYEPEARPVIEDAVRRAMETGQPWDLELPLTTAKGRSIWVRAVGEVERLDGKPVRLVGAFQDVTAKHQLETQLVESERFLRQLTDSLPLRIAYLDDRRRYRFANKELLKHFGRSREDVIGRTRAELKPQEDDTILGLRAQEALGGQAQHFEFEEQIGDQIRRIENRLIPDREADGQVRGFFVTGIDITQRAAAEAALHELTAIFDNTTDFIVQTDWRGRITYLNASARAALGFAPDESVDGREFSQFITAETNQKFEQEILPVVRASGVWVGENTVILAGGRIVPVSHMVLAHRDDNGRIQHFSGILRDVSAQAMAGQEIARQTETLRLVAEAIPATVAVVDTDGRYRFVNTAFERWCGLPRAEILGRKASEVLGEAAFAPRLPWIRRAMRGEEVTFELAQGAPGEQRHTQVTYVPLQLSTGAVEGFVTVSQDITRQKQEEVRLKALAQKDALTGLFNRAGFEEALQGMQDTGLSLAVLYIDLDRFKPVNDTYGHPVGDEVLRAFGQRLTHLVRPTDYVARIGGDEFAIALSGLPDNEPAQKLAETVLVAARRPFEIGRMVVVVGASVGVAYGEQGQVNWRDVVSRSDQKLLQAKAAGRGRQVSEAR